MKEFSKRKDLPRANWQNVKIQQVFMKFTKKKTKKLEKLLSDLEQLLE